MTDFGVLMSRKDALERALAERVAGTTDEETNLLIKELNDTKEEMGLLQVYRRNRR